MLKIMYATMTGSAEMAAREMSAELEDEEVEHKVVNLKNAKVADFASGDTIIVVTSTYGDGMVPDPAIPIYEALQGEKPDLSGVRYVVFGLGDQKNHGSTFNFGGKRFDELLNELGATRIRERHAHDSTAGVYVDDAAIDWIGEHFEEIVE